MLNSDCYKAILEIILLCSKNKNSGSFKNVMYKMCSQIIFTLEQKYKTVFKNEEKDIVYNFHIMKIRYMKDKVWRQFKNMKKFQLIFFMYISIYTQF